MKAEKAIQNEYKNIPLDKIVASKTNPRKRFKQDSLNEMADNMKSVGVLEPVLVRAKGKTKFELVCGERRWKAAQIAELVEVPARIMTLDDEQVLEIQIHENLHREDVHPLDEALGYQSLMDAANLTVAELALRVGKSESFVHQRLKLNDLIEEAKQDLENGHLPIAHGLEMAKFPDDAQKEILDEVTYINNQREIGAQTFREFRKNIARHILLNLKHAPFSLKSELLRADGLTCIECPARSGANPTLFGQEDLGEDDKCLNINCYEGKLKSHIQLQIEEIRTEDDIKKPAVLTDFYYRSESDGFPDALKNDKYTRIDDGKKKCQSAERAVWIDGTQKGQKQWICRDNDCKKHKRRNPNSSSQKSDDQMREERLMRKEEIFDASVAEPVRLKVLKLAAENFDAAQTVFNHANAETYQKATVQRMWELQCREDKDTAENIRTILGLEKNELKLHSWQDDPGAPDACDLSDDFQAKMLFLLLYAHKNRIYSTYYKPQTEVRQLAANFGINYDQIDARERLAQSPKKHKDVFRDYQERLEAGDKPNLPRVYSAKYKREETE